MKTQPPLKQAPALGAVLISAVLLTTAQVHGRTEATWTSLANLAPDLAGTMLLLTDGAVVAQGYTPASRWMKLTPDSTGSYVNGTWSSIASMSTPRLYFASHVLPNGKVWVLGGEYTGNPLSARWTNTGEIYDPIANVWSPIAHHPDAIFGDDPSMLLNDGRILAGSILSRNTFLYDLATNSWSSAIAKFYNDQSDEETWGKLPGGRVLTYDLFKSIATGGGYAELYDSLSNAWSPISASDGTANGSIPQLSSVALGFELGPMLRLQDSRLLAIGATQHTALYTPSTNTWAAGPDIIGTLNGNAAFFGSDDAAAAIVPTGHVIFAADAGPALGVFRPPTQLFDFDPDTNSISPISPAFPAQAVLNQAPAFITRMLVLPTGELLFSDSSRQLWVYTPSGSAPNRLRPRIEGISYDGGGVFTLSGQQLNGQSAGSSYGDDAESDENYPVVWLTGKDGSVAFGRTTHWTTTDVSTGVLRQSVKFTLPAGLTPGVYQITVSGAGIKSVNSVSRNIEAEEIAGN
jgi:Kelch motif